MTQERRDQKGTEVNEERLNRESGCDGGRAGGSLLSRFVPSVVSRVPTPFHSPARPGSLATRSPYPPSPVTTDRPSLAPYVGRSCRYASAATRTGSVRPKGPFHGRTGPAARSEENVDNERSRKADMETDDSRHSHG